MPTPCLFCDNNSGSREHLWPKWMHEKKNFGPIKIMRGDKQQIIVPDPEQKVQTVCGICNNGWMSDLESASIPIIGKMFDDEAIILDRSQQELVAAWGSKTAMVLDSTRPRADENRGYQKAECVAMREHLIIPDRTRIWIGRLDSSHLNATGTDFSIVDKADRIGTGIGGTIVAGHFAVQVVTQHIEPGKDAPDMQSKPGNWNETLIQIWPIQQDTVSWPPRASFTNGGPAGIAYLLDRWRMGEKVEKIARLKS